VECGENYLCSSLNYFFERVSRVVYQGPNANIKGAAQKEAFGGRNDRFDHEGEKTLEEETDQGKKRERDRSSESRQW